MALRPGCRPSESSPRWLARRVQSRRKIELIERERSEHESLVRAQKTPQAVARRAHVVLLAATG